jgi:hypothetical protein
MDARVEHRTSQELTGERGAAVADWNTGGDMEERHSPLWSPPKPAYPW